MRSSQKRYVITVCRAKVPVYYRCGRWGGGGGSWGSKPRASRTLHFRLPPLFSCLPHFNPFVDCEILRFGRVTPLPLPLFLPLHTLLEPPPSVLFSSAYPSRPASSRDPTRCPPQLSSVYTEPFFPRDKAFYLRNKKKCFICGLHWLALAIGQACH